MVINHNMSAVYANRQLQFNARKINESIEKLSSGMRINSAGDDASGLAVSEKMRSQIRGNAQAERNALDGISFIQTTEGYLQETQDILHRLRELAIQAANGIYTKSDREQIQVEVNQLLDEIDRIANSAQFNGMKMLTGDFAQNGNKQMFFHVGANQGERFNVFIDDMSKDAVLNLTQEQPTLDLTTVQGADAVVGKVDDATVKVSKQRANLGAYQNRLEYTAKGLAVAHENIMAAESRIRDTDMAEEMVSYTKHLILHKAGVSMLAQANVKSQAVLKLLQ